MIRLLALLACLLLVVPVRPAAAENTSELTEILQTLSTRAASITTISSRFTQEKRLSMFDSVLVSTGRFAYAKPDRLRWEYVTPIVEGFAISGSEGVRWSDSVERKQHFVLRQDPVMHIVAGQLLAWATFDLDRLRQEYDISCDSTAPVVLHLTPRSQDTRAVLQYLLIEFTPSQGTVARVELHEQGDDTTRIMFSDTAINQPLDPAVFR